MRVPGKPSFRHGLGFMRGAFVVTCPAVKGRGQLSLFEPARPNEASPEGVSSLGLKGRGMGRAFQRPAARGPFGAALPLPGYKPFHLGNQGVCSRLVMNIHPYFKK